MLKKSIYTLIWMSIVVSCSDKYLSYTRYYQFNREAGVPDYRNLDYWAAHPWKQDPSDSVPAPLRGQARDSLVDVFFLYPTSFTDRSKASVSNAPINDTYLAAKTDYSSILYQASAFNQHARVFAPRYRQAHYANFLKKDTAAARQAFELAYDDIRMAFEEYLAYYNKGRPIILASHSQGSLLGERLLKEFFDGKPLQKQLVAAYVLGWPIPRDYFGSLVMCEDSTQTGCLCGWRTFRKGYFPDYVAREDGSSLVTNPLSWTITDIHALRDLNRGSVLTRFNKVYRRVTDAQIHEGILWVKKPRFPWGFLYRSKNYHIGDINLFYVNIRGNVETRIRQFLSDQ